MKYYVLFFFIRKVPKENRLATNRWRYAFAVRRTRPCSVWCRKARYYVIGWFSQNAKIEK